MENIEKIEKVLKPIIERLGYELVSVLCRKPNGVDTVTVVIWKQGIMDLSDCETVHNAINDTLDEINPSDDKPYTLEVSSMGLDWKLKTDDDFRRRLGEELEILISKTDDNSKKKEKIIGKLLSFDADAITLEDALAKQNVISRKNIAKATVAIKF